MERREPPLVPTSFDSLNFEDLKKEINAAFSLKPSFQTLETRTQLAIVNSKKNINKIKFN